MSEPAGGGRSGGALAPPERRVRPGGVGRRVRLALAAVAAGAGGGLAHLGRFDAGARALRAAVALCGSDERWGLARLVTFNRLGMAHKAAGRYEAAEGCYRQVLAALDAQPERPGGGAGQPTVALRAVIYHNLAGLAYARGDHQVAEELIGHSLDLRPSQDEHGLALDRGLLGAVLAAQGRHDEARQLLSRVLATMERLYGTADYEVAVVCHNLAVVERHTNPTLAGQLYRRALQIKQRRLGPQHPEVGVLLNNLAVLHRQQGDPATATRLSAAAGRILTKRLPPSHPAVSTCQRNRGRLNQRRTVR